MGDSQKTQSRPHMIQVYIDCEITNLIHLAMAGCTDAVTCLCLRCVCVRRGLWLVCWLGAGGLRPGASSITGPGT